ncbi:12894_t:CDS:10 [Ambispora gerdemannii]|uniref:12894_t:CDS:1 n=1 Tax=Ambispora gerdemannii TaxID=144530 RepID=A0A9N8V1Q9_9GLOM|nr:12894_t:CDS:10 [Ambispora gerdemannii]
MSTGPHTPMEENDISMITHEIVVDSIVPESEDHYMVEERPHRSSRGDEEDTYRNRRRRTSSRSQSPPPRKRSHTPIARRSRSPRRSPRRSRSPRSQPREGADSYRPSRRSSHNDHYEPADRRDRDAERDRGDRDRGTIAASQRSQKECRVYVGNLAYEVKWGQLKDFMRQAGEVVFADVLLQPNGMSKGCGVVEYRTPEEARRAIETLNDTSLLGRPIFIREDRESEAKFVNGRQIFVGNIPYSVGWQELKDLFRNAGSIIRADILIGHDGRSKGSGTVLFETPKDASHAISLYDGYEWNGRRIEVREVGRCLVMLYLGLLLGGNKRRNVVREEKEGKFCSSKGMLIFEEKRRVEIVKRRELDRFAGGPPPPRFAGRPNSRPFTASSFGAAGSNNGFYGPATAANAQPGGGFGTNFSSSNLNVAASAATVATPEQYDGYGGGSAGYNDFGSGVTMMDYTNSGYNAGYGGPFGGSNGSQIFVRNLPFTTTNLDLRDLFKHCGNVMRAEILEQGGRPKGAGIVQFDSYDSARLAVEKFNGYSYGGRLIDVYFDRFA